MSKEKIYIFDTTLRDGAQTEGVNFSIDDKNKIAKALSDLGVDYLEGGWPGANTLDTTRYKKTHPKIIKSKEHLDFLNSQPFSSNFWVGKLIRRWRK